MPLIRSVLSCSVTTRRVCPESTQRRSAASAVALMSIVTTAGYRRHHLPRLLLVQVEDAREHPRLARVELAAAAALGDQQLEVVGGRGLVELRLGVHADRPQHRVGHGVERPDERLEGHPEQLERARRAAHRGLGVGDREDLRHLLADRDVQRGGDEVGDRRARSASDTPWGTESPSRLSIRLAIAGSPMKPMPSEAIVMPSWQADRYSSMRSICMRGQARPPRRPPRPSRPCLDVRARTRPNSAATKKPLAATSTATPSSRRSSVIGPLGPQVRGPVRAYFEVRRRPSERRRGR